MKKILLFITIIAVAFACKKSEDSEPILTLTKNNIAGKYKTEAATFTPSGSGAEIDVFNIDTVYKPCKRDDILTFDTFNIYTYTDTGVICSPKGTTAPSTYTLTAPSTLTYGGKDFTVQSLTSSRLIITRVDTFVIPGSGSISGVGKITLKRQ